MEIATISDGALGFRLCPACGHPSTLLAGHALWPSGFACANCGHLPLTRDGIVMLHPELADTVSGFDPADFAFLAEAELLHFWFTTRRELIGFLVDRHFPRATRFAEIGCGSGNVLGYLARARAWQRLLGTDIHTRGLSLARPRLPAKVELLQLDARRMPFRAAFDLIGAFDVLEHIPEDEEVLRGFAAALVPGGGLIVTVPQHPFLWSAADEVAHHVRRYRRGEMEAKLCRAGFSVLFSTSFTALLSPAMLASRLLSRRRAGRGDPRALARAEFALPRGLNAMLAVITRTEIALTRRGVRWPFGGSRVVVAIRAA